MTYEQHRRNITTWMVTFIKCKRVEKAQYALNNKKGTSLNARQPVCADSHLRNSNYSPVATWSHSKSSESKQWFPSGWLWKVAISNFGVYHVRGSTCNSFLITLLRKTNCMRKRYTLYNITISQYHSITSQHHSITSQHHNISVPQYHITLSQHLSTTISQHHSTTISHHSITTSQYHVTVSQHHSITISQCHSVRVSQYHIITVPQYHITVSQRQSITTSQCHSVTVSQHHNVRVSQYHNVTVSQYHNITIFPKFNRNRLLYSDLSGLLTQHSDTRTPWNVRPVHATVTHGHPEMSGVFREHSDTDILSDQ